MKNSKLMFKKKIMFNGLLWRGNSNLLAQVSHLFHWAVRELGSGLFLQGYLSVCQETPHWPLNCLTTQFLGLLWQRLSLFLGWWWLFCFFLLSKTKIFFSHQTNYIAFLPFILFFSSPTSSNSGTLFLFLFLVTPGILSALGFILTTRWFQIWWRICATVLCLYIGLAGLTIYTHEFFYLGRSTLALKMVAEVGFQTVPFLSSIFEPSFDFLATLDSYSWYALLSYGTHEYCDGFGYYIPPFMWLNLSGNLWPLLSGYNVFCFFIALGYNILDEWAYEPAVSSVLPTLAFFSNATRALFEETLSGWGFQGLLYVPSTARGGEAPWFTFGSGGLVVLSCKLTFINLLMLTTVGVVLLCVFLYSVEYMANDPGVLRFLSHLLLFSFFMNIFILSDDLVSLYLGWEGIGLSSFFLINFWYTRLQAAKAAFKAVLVNKIGDLSLLVSIALTQYYFGTTQIAVLEKKFFSFIQRTHIFYFWFWF